MTSFDFWPKPFWLLGCGNMAGAMLSRWLRPSGRSVAPGVRVLTALMLGVKPQKLGDVAADVARAIGVASPGGTTRAGLNVLDADGALNDLMRRTIEAAQGRGAEMAAAAREAIG